MENENKMQRCITDPRQYELIKEIILMWTAVIFMALGLQLYSLYACASVCLCLGLYAYASVFLTVCLCFLSFKARTYLFRIYLNFYEQSYYLFYILCFQ